MSISTVSLLITELEYSDIFPDEISDNTKNVEFTYAEYITLLWDNYLCYLDIEYEAEDFNAELDRISSITAGTDIKYYEDNAVRNVLYSEEYFNYPAYIECIDSSVNECYSYALIDEDNKRIIYIYINGIISNSRLKFIREYLPKDYDISSYEDDFSYSEFQYRVY